MREVVIPTLALLAGGLATRLRPLTHTIPKAMIDIAGTPFIARQLRLIASEGGRRVVICTGFLGEQIEKYVGDGARFGLKVDYSPDGDHLLGTGGALCKALPLLGEEFLVMYGDSYLPTPFRPAIEAFRTSEKQGLMTVFRNDGRWDRSNVLFADGEIRVYDKQSSNTDMQHIDFGLGMFQSAVFSKWSKQQVFGLEAVYQRLLAEGQLASYETTDRFFEIGSVEGIREATRYFNKMKEMNHAGASV